MQNLPLPVIISMVGMNSDLFPLALLFREYAISGIDWHRRMIAHHSRIVNKVYKSSETCEYLFRNVRHRNSLSPQGPGPAVITTRREGTYYSWYENGRRHREKGPASVFIGTNKGEYSFSWYQYGWRYREHNLPTNSRIYPTGFTVHRYANDGGKTHRVDGPAYEDSNGVQKWMINQVLHRLDGPAVIRRNRHTWYYEGKIHRSGGPAVTIFDDEGRVTLEVWYTNGVFGQSDNGRSELLAMNCQVQTTDAREYFPDPYLRVLPTPFQVWSRGKEIKAILYI